MVDKVFLVSAVTVQCAMLIADIWIWEFWKRIRLDYLS